MDMNRLKDGIREKVNTVKMLAVFCAGRLAEKATASTTGASSLFITPLLIDTSFHRIQRIVPGGSLFRIRIVVEVRFPFKRVPEIILHRNGQAL